MSINATAIKLYFGMKTKRKKIIFIFQLADGFLKAIKCLLFNDLEIEFAGLETEPFDSDASDKELSMKATAILKKLKYRNERLVISLPRNLSACRYLKIPSHIPGEIEKIINLQAGRYLPYPASDLVTGYEIIQIDKEGYAHINLVIAHRDAIKKVLDLLSGLKSSKISICLSSYGVVNLYNHLIPKGDLNPVMVIDVDAYQAELVVISGGKLLFSRSFKLAHNSPNLRNLFLDEVNKSRNLYQREVMQEPAKKIYLIGSGENIHEYAAILKQQTSLTPEVLFYDKRISYSTDVSGKILETQSSLTSLIGLALEEMRPELNLLPSELKDKIKAATRKKEHLRLAVLIIAAILIGSLGVAKNFANKAEYLARLKTELNKVVKEAEPLERIDRRFKFMEGRLQRGASVLDVLYELNKVTPEGVSLDTFSYQDDNLIVLRGHAPELNLVFTFTAGLEEAAGFKDFSPKVRFATQKRTQAGEIIDFEIACFKK